MPSQAILNCYLLNAPGQKASITGFVSFMNKHHAANLVIQLNAQKTLSLRRKRLEAELAELLADKRRDDAFKTKWIAVSLAYFHGLPRSVGTNFKSITVKTDADGNFTVHWNGGTYLVPHWDFRSGAEN